jgi:prefoldin alpha subunit
MATEGIRIEELPIPQLQQVKQQLEEEIQVLTQSFAKLKQAQVKFSDCMETLKRINQDQQDKTLLLPLTNSLYVTGTLEDSQKVIVDVGTGYFVEKEIVDAKEFYKRKVDYVKSNLLKLEDTVNQRQNQRKSISSSSSVIVCFGRKNSRTAKRST